jgi:group I intron endonuclease
LIFLGGHEDKGKNGVYCIKSTVDDRLYIGSVTRGFEDRHKEHLYDLKKNQHGNTYLQAFTNKYGIDKLQFEILEVVEDKDKVLEREQYWIDRYWAAGLLFNMAKKAGAPMAGRHHNEEAKEKISFTHKGKNISEDHRRKIQLANIGKIVSESTREKLSLANSRKNNGRKHTEEELQKMRGRKHTKEEIEKLRKANLGRKHTEETKVKISLARKKRN